MNYTETKRVVDALERGECPTCGAPLQFGSRDPCEGDYYHCSAGCGADHILYPLYHKMPKTVEPVIDSEKMNESLRMIAQLIKRSKA